MRHFKSQIAKCKSQIQNLWWRFVGVNLVAQKVFVLPLEHGPVIQLRPHGSKGLLIITPRYVWEHTGKRCFLLMGLQKILALAGD